MVAGFLKCQSEMQRKRKKTPLMEISGVGDFLIETLVSNAG
jgi:hypothetical protein